MAKGIVANLFKVVFVVYFLHVKFPCLDYPALLPLGQSLILLKKLPHESMHQFGDVLPVGIVGFDVLIEIVDD